MLEENDTREQADSYAVGQYRPVDIFDGFGYRPENTRVALASSRTVREAYAHCGVGRPGPITTALSSVWFLLLVALPFAFFCLLSVPSLAGFLFVWFCIGILYGFFKCSKETVKLLKRHFAAETGTLFGDPDLGGEPEVEAYAPTESEKASSSPPTVYEPLGTTVIRREAKALEIWTPVKVQEVLNRHWGFHARRKDQMTWVTTEPGSFVCFLRAIPLTLLALTIAGPFVGLLLGCEQRRCVIEGDPGKIPLFNPGWSSEDCLKAANTMTAILGSAANLALISCGACLLGSFLVFGRLGFVAWPFATFAMLGFLLSFWGRTIGQSTQDVEETVDDMVRQRLATRAYGLKHTGNPGQGAFGAILGELAARSAMGVKVLTDLINEKEFMKVSPAYRKEMSKLAVGTLTPVLVFAVVFLIIVIVDVWKSAPS